MGSAMPRLIAILVLVCSLAMPVYAQEGTPTTESEQTAEGDAVDGETKSEAPEEENLEAPYDEQLLRLSEVLGSIHYLRALCGAEENSRWRDHMSAILETEKPTPQRRARLIARFNRGFRAFDEIYRNCTASARLAARRYQQEGIRLSSQITNRYGR